jgi:superfamily II DNA helicase RecQ
VYTQSSNFEKPETKNVLDSWVHGIIVATGAMRKGIDDPDIRLVAQWGVPLSLGTLLQRTALIARDSVVNLFS